LIDLVLIPEVGQWIPLDIEAREAACIRPRVADWKDATDFATKSTLIAHPPLSYLI
jgi:hypothetical protein